MNENIMNDASLLDQLSALAELPSAEELKSVKALVEKALERQRYIAKLEDALQREKKALNLILTSALPDLMASAGTKEFTTEEGFKVSIKDFLSGSLPKDEDKRTVALEWLRGNGAEDLIKNELHAHFDRGQDNVAGDVAGKLQEAGIAFEQAVGVHPSTLKAYANERMRNGEDVPLELLGLYAGRIAEIQRPK